MPYGWVADEHGCNVETIVEAAENLKPPNDGFDLGAKNTMGLQLSENGDLANI